MVQSAEKVVGPIRVGVEIIKGNFKQKPEIQKDFDEIFNEINKYKTYTELATKRTYTDVATQPGPELQ